MAVANMSLATTMVCEVGGNMTPGVGFPANPRDPTCREFIALVFKASAKINKKVCPRMCGRGA